MEFEELDYQDTLLGAISLRRRAEPRLGGKIVYEVKLGDEFLMSSLFTVAESELANIGLAALDGPDLDIVVGGLGLGYTAAAVLRNRSVGSLMVIEMLQPVIDWHRRGLVPLGRELTGDLRCSLIHANFFEFAAPSEYGFDPVDAERLFHGVLLDIDHSPRHWLDPRNGAFYTPRGLTGLIGKLHPGGVFGMWSNEPPDAEFTRVLGTVFHKVDTNVVNFPNPYQGAESTATIYLAQK